MPKKLIICAHGCGDHQQGFHEAWAGVLNHNHDSSKFKVTGLFWDDLQDQLIDKFFDINEDTRILLEQTFLKNAFDYLDDPEKAPLLDFIKENVFDALSYLFFKEFRNATIFPKCILRLNDLLNQHSNYQPVLIGHSLGSIMLTHITWLIRQTTGNMNFYDLFLAGSPIGLRSPLAMLPDFIDLLADIGQHPDRMEALNIWAQEWWSHRRKRLHIIINELDPIAWDVKMDIGIGDDVDILPVRQGLSQEEITKIETANALTVQRFQHGSKKAADIIDNHDVLNYLDSEPFKNAFDVMLASA